MEQSYGGIDGDSASAAELLGLVSAIAGIPLRQDVAVTGSINQRGDIQPIGAVNEKIEGFFDVCRQSGLTGAQGVCIPEANVRNLVLRQDVIGAVEAGQFHIWAVKHIDDAMELVSGIPAGSADEPSSVHGRVAERLRQMERRLKPPLAAPREKDVTSGEQAPVPPRDPRPPLPGQP
jgi:predicted ATP-dependent protease